MKRLSRSRRPPLEAATAARWVNRVTPGLALQIRLRVEFPAGYVILGGGDVFPAYREIAGRFGLAWARNAGSGVACTS